MKNLFLVLFLVTIVSVVIGHTAHAGVLTFEDLYPGYEGWFPLPAGYGGFEWGGGVYCTTKYYSPGGQDFTYGTVGNVSLWDGLANWISLNRSVPFNFTGAYVTSLGEVSQPVDVEGWRGGTKIYTTQIVTDIPGPYWFDFNFQNVDTVFFYSQGTYWRRHLIFDNITYSESVVPEPSTMLLFLAGIALVAITLRYQKRCQTPA